MQYQRIFLNARHEAVLIASIWLAALIWTVPYCYASGYSNVEDGKLEMVMGVPSWVFWGVAVPWLVADVLTTIVCFTVMQDDDLEEGMQEGASS